MTLALASCLAVHAEAENRTASDVKSAIETMPPRYLANITCQMQRDSNSIIWGQPEQVQHNRAVLQQFRDWLAEHERK